MKRNILKITLLSIFVSLISSPAFAQQRVVEESLVYDDPTVAKPGKWLFGGSLGAYYSNANTSGSDTSGNTTTATQQFTQPLVTAFAGYDDLTILLRYQKIKATTQFPNNPMTTDGNTYSADLRWMLSAISAKHFVPYVLASYVDQTENETFGYVNTNGLRQTGKVHAKGPGLGVGGIIPITEKYGFRVDARQYKINSVVTSNMWSGLNSDSYLQYRLFLATAYYNITDNINLQIGGQSSYVLNRPQTTAYGLFTQIGYTFK